MSAPEAVVNPPAQPAEDSNFVQLRNHAKSLESQLADLKSQLGAANEKATTLEREKMSEVQRLQSERDEYASKATDTDRLRNELGRFQSTVETLYKTRFESLPAEARPHVEAATGKVESWADKLDILGSMEAAFGAIKPSSIGTPTQPANGIGTPTQPAQQADPNAAKPNLSQTLAAPMQWKPVPGQPGYQG